MSLNHGCLLGAKDNYNLQIHKKNENRDSFISSQREIKTHKVINKNN